MNVEFKPGNRSERTIAVTVALVVTVLLHGVVFGLAAHYDRQYLRVATSRANAVVATHQGKTPLVRSAPS